MRYGKPIRLPRDRYVHPDTTFHLVVRTHPEVRKLPVPVRNAIWEALLTDTQRCHVVIHAAVLMPDHVHIIASPREWGIVRWIGAWKSLSTRAAWAAGHHGAVWQRRFYDRALRGEEEFEVARTYVLRNPEADGLVEAGEAWPHAWLREEYA